MCDNYNVLVRCDNYSTLYSIRTSSSGFVQSSRLLFVRVIYSYHQNMLLQYKYSICETCSLCFHSPRILFALLLHFDLHSLLSESSTVHEFLTMFVTKDFFPLLIGINWFPSDNFPVDRLLKLKIIDVQTFYTSIVVCMYPYIQYLQFFLVVLVIAYMGCRVGAN